MLIVGTLDFTITGTHTHIHTHILWHSGNEDHIKFSTLSSEIVSGTEIKHKASKICSHVLRHNSTKWELKPTVLE